VIYGVGNDILKISNIVHSVTSPSDPFIKKIYTQNEIDLIQKRPCSLNGYATRFSGKEAVFKSLSLPGDNIRFNEIEILENEIGQPVVALLGNAKIYAEQKGITAIYISLSCDTEYATAFAIAVSCAGNY
jgi:phosphopantetheine--protein transferase-like protein